MAKVWNVNFDCTTRQASQLFFELKTILLNNGWALVASSDGTNVTNGASPDRVSTVALFDVTNAYYVLRDPASLFWLYVQRGASNVTNTIKVSRVAPQSNGTATVMPTCAVAADEKTILSNVTSFTSGGSPRGQIITYDAAENLAGVRPFYCLMTDGTGTLRGALVLEAAADGTYAAANAYPWAVAHATGNGVFVSGVAEWTWYYSPGSVFSADSIMPEPFNNVYLAGQTGVGVNPWSSLDEGLPNLLGRGSAQTQPGLWGYWKNLRLRGVVRAYPDTVTVSGERYIYAGSCLVPYANGVTPL